MAQTDFQQALRHFDVLRAVFADISQIQGNDGNSVTILCDNPDADTVDTQAAVEVSADFTGWRSVRYWGCDWPSALHKAAEASRAFQAQGRVSSVDGS